MNKLIRVFQSILQKPVSYKHPRILMYHMVSPWLEKGKFNKLRVKPDEFEKQVRFLAKNGWHFATMSELTSQNELPYKSVCITFDDGFKDNYTNAHPILEAYDAKATLFLVCDRHDRDWSTSKKAHHNSGELLRESKLTNNEVNSMLSSGVWELGAHTITHANLPKNSDEMALIEISKSKLDLENQFKTQVDSFAYPFGIYEDREVLMVSRSGYKSAVTTIEGISLTSENPFELKRIKVSGKDSLSAFKRKLDFGK